MSIIIFAGPSVHGLDIPSGSGLTICPPAAQGDIFRACLSTPTAIGLIDGYFESVPSVWHKEILWAISKGIAVFGSASMGALRAAELDSYGMIGVGRIYQWYSEGQLEDDDEVALLHGPVETGFLPLSEPMVNIRATCEAGVLASVLNQSTADAIITCGKNMHYRDRTWDHLLAVVADQHTAVGDLAQFAQWKVKGNVDQKQRDAAELIEIILKPLNKIQSPTEFHFEWTSLWDQAVQEWLSNEKDPESLSANAILDELRLDPELFDDIYAEALTRSILLREADRRQFVVDMTEKRAALGRLRASLKLTRKVDLDAWAVRNMLTETELENLVDDEARRDAVSRLSVAALRPHIIALLKSKDQYAHLAKRAAEKQGILREMKSASAQEMTELSPPQLLNWFFRTRHKQAAPTDLDSILQNLRLESRQEFYRLLGDEYVYVTSGKGTTENTG